MFIRHRFLILIFLIFPSSFFPAESNQIEEASELKEVFLDFNYPDKKIQIIADRTYILSDKIFELQGVSITTEAGDKSFNINSLIATFDQTSKKIYMEDSVKFVTRLEDKQIIISSEELQYDMSEDNLSSSKKSIVTFNDLKVISSNFSFLQSGEDIKAIFLDGKVSLNLSNEVSTGMANKVIVLFNKNQIFLEGDATFDQKGLLIKSDFIHYDISKNEIIKSLNSRVEKSI
ncbi:MAG: hypothetical protein CM15mP86_11070 [Gammaproteobacteria bacterium]|nr:MAG: hypothetical protein CM15mP86_11070 [Gammaproteobacteria bacterium]